MTEEYRSNSADSRFRCATNSCTSN